MQAEGAADSQATEDSREDADGPAAQACPDAGQQTGRRGCALAAVRQALLLRVAHLES